MTTSLPVLTFHALDDRSSVISFAPRVFREGMAMLHARGYRTIGLMDAVAYVRRRQRFPDRTFVLTFDDGFQTVYTEAFPVLQAHGMSATVFLTVGAADARQPSDRLPTFEGRAMLSWREIREMGQAGIDFGAHTLTHPDLTRTSPRAAAREMASSKARIEATLGTAVTTFAYPFGRYDAEVRRMAQEHFACACADTLGLVSSGSDVHALERVDAYYLRTRRLFEVMGTGLFPWYVRARSIPRRARRLIERRLRS